MRFALGKTELNRSIKTVTPVMPRHSTLDILHCIHFQVGPDGLSLTGTNLEQSITRQLEMPTVPADQGAVCIQKPELLSILKDAPKGSDLKFETVDGGKVDIHAGDRIFRVKDHGAHDYPPLRFRSLKTLQLSGDLLCELIDQVKYCMSTEETRYFLHGVFMLFDQDKTEFVGCDGRRLAIATAKPARKAPKDAQSGIVPLGAVSRIGQLFSKSKAVRVKFGKVGKFDELRFTDGISTLTTRLCDGEYPKYKEIIPEGRDHRVIVNRDAFRDALASVMRVKHQISAHRPNESSVRFDVGHDTLTLSTRSCESDDKASETVSLQNGNGAMAIGFDGHYWTDAFKTIPSDHVEIEFGDELSCAVLRPFGERNSKLRGHMDLIMPMRLSS